MAEETVKTLKRSINAIQVVGTLKEKNLALEGVKEREIGADKIKVTCNRISKKEFKNPAFVVESNGMPIEIEVSFGVDEKMVDKDGNVVDNPKFKELTTILDTYVCGETRVKVDGSLTPNEYVDREYNYKTYLPKIEMFHMTSSNVPENDLADGEISGVISKIMPEVKNEEETGRLNVELYSFDYKCATFPVSLTVEADIADDFESYYEPNNSVKIYFEAKTVQHGSPKVSTGGFGRRETNRVSGYTTTEYSVFRGDEPFEEENEYYVDGDTMSTALNERQMMIDERIAKKKASDEESPKTSTKSPSGAGAGKPSPFGAPKAQGTTTKKSPF